MAQVVLGLDLGSHSAKAMVVKLGLRGSEPVRFDLEPVELGADGRPVHGGVLRAAARLVERLGGSFDTVHCAVPGDAATVRAVSLPASAGRRLDQVLKFELDDLVPYDIDDAVFDQVEIARSGDELRLLAAVVPLFRVREILEGLAEGGVDPREIGVAPLAYGMASAEVEGPAALVDMGHTRTDVAVIGDDVPTTRTILRGGRDLTARLAEVGRVSWEQAEAYKLRDGLSGRVGEVLREALRPLLREIRQSIKGHLAAGGRRVERVLLCGGSSLLAGLDEILEEEIGVPVERYEVDPEGVAWPSAVPSPEAAVLAHFLARREEIPRVRRINVRRGPLAFRGDYDFLKRRIGWAAACILGVLLAWIFANYAEYRVLSDQAAEQKARLTETTMALFGEDLSDPAEIAKRLKAVSIEEAPIPEKDAFDIVVELSKRIPTSVVHDVELLEIKPKRITLKGIVDAELATENPEDGEGDAGVSDAGTELSPTDLVQQKLAEFTECFTSIRIGKVQAMEERRRYQMDIESKCP